MQERTNCKPSCFLHAILAALAALAMAMPSPAQTYTTLVNFDGSNGAAPYYAALVQGRDGNLWGTTTGGGANNGGTVFKMSPAGSLTTVYSFCARVSCTDGYNPVAGLLLGRDGNFYGTASKGGDINGCDDPYGCGVIFKITPKGAYTVLHTYEVSDLAAGPVGGLIQATNGSFYGDGGLDNGGMAVYKITSSGTYTEVASWDLNVLGQPYGGLIQGADGLLYGTASLGGTGSCNDGCGAVFKVQTNGKKMVTLHSFDASDGEDPVAGLVQAADGNFYGATVEGGPSVNLGNCDFVYPYGQCGTLFKITSTGGFTPLYDFCPESATSISMFPFGTLIQATNGNLYGTTQFEESSATARFTSGIRLRIRSALSTAFRRIAAV